MEVQEPEDTGPICDFVCGGVGESRPADPEVQVISDSVKSEVETKTGQTYDTFQAKSYTKQTVGGYNYFVKVHAGKDKYLELFVFKGMDGELVLRRVEESKE
ncbi:cystatin-A-like [Eucyclogobius newberryi]|uniref:cystatin-A-like n=1 Tax=Eucyclogobius newberryi TaxID=166745 RepID=UPI003B5A5F8C